MARLGVSPLVSAVILIAVIFAIAASIAPWMFGITTELANQSSTTAQTHMLCQNTAYDYDTGYGTFGVSWNFSGSQPTSDILQAKVVNTGTVNLYNFSFEIEIDSSGTLEILEFPVNGTSQRTSANPLKPGSSTILRANLTQNLEGTLKSVKVMNLVCPDVYISQEL
jgi:FlaG/FlaF family flagellin (archaellin)